MWVNYCDVKDGECYLQLERNDASDILSIIKSSQRFELYRQDLNFSGIYSHHIFSPQEDKGGSFTEYLFIFFKDVKVSNKE